MPAPRIDLSGIVGADIAPAAVKAFLQRTPNSPVDVHVNSPGGSVFAGLEIYNAIRDHGQATITVDGLAASAASLIAMSGKKIVMKPGALMMLHRASAMTIGHADAHRQSAGVLDKIDDEVTGIYADRAGMTRSRAAALLDKESWFDGGEAVAAGLADHAEDVSETNGARARASLTATEIRNLFKNPPQALFALAAMESPMPELNPAPANPAPAAAPAATDITAQILDRATAANLTLAETNAIVKDAGGSLDKARDLITAKLIARDPSRSEPYAPAAVVGDGFGGNVTGFAAALGDALLGKLKGTAPVGAGKPLAGMSIAQLAAEFIRGTGTKLAGHDTVSIMRQALTMRAGGALTTSDFPTILGGSLNQSLANLFKAADGGISTVAGASTLPDFRAMSLGKLSSFPELLEVGESGEIEFGSLEDGGETISVATYARLLHVTLQTLTNDNLGAVERSIRDIAFAATNLKAKLLINALLTATMSDGKTLFHADHGNIVDTTKPTVTSVDAVRQAMRQQKAIDGTTVLGLAPRVLLVPSTLETVTEIITTATLNPNSVDQANPFTTKLVAAAEPRLDAIDDAAWYAFADPAVLPAITFGTLEGMAVPKLEIADPSSFDRLGTAFRVWWACGAAPVEYRAAVKATGTGE
jgi:ATP-dependent protease ClpP protease subunit